MNLSSQRVPLKELSIFTRQLAMMLRAGIPLTSALAILGRQKHSVALNNALSTVEEAVHNGESIAIGMRRCPQCFPPFYTTLVAAGEYAGILDQTLDTAYEQLEAQRTLRSRMVRAAIYPAVVCSTLAVIMLFLLTWVVPTFEELFAESGVPLPWLTRIVLSISALLSHYGPLALVTAVVLTALCVWYRKRSAGSAGTFQGLVLHIPLWRNLLRAKHASECSALLAALTRVGIPILEGLAITAQTIQSSTVEAAIQHIQCEVSEGHSLSSAFRASHYFPDMFSHLIEVGESSGNLEAMLTKAASFYRAEVEQSIELLKQLVEPALILTIGALVGTTVLALYLPIFQIGELAGIR
jgi:type IV pilus assembly protein PilC